MKTLELFPECDAQHDPPCHADSRCTVCYTPEFIADTESFHEACDDDKRDEDDTHYWYWDDNDYAEQVCIKRKGEL
jgi:hypothetical protein